MQRDFLTALHVAESLTRMGFSGKPPLSAEVTIHACQQMLMCSDTHVCKYVCYRDMVLIVGAYYAGECMECTGKPR